MTLSVVTSTAITEAAARCVAIDRIAAEVGLRPDQWKAALRDDLEVVRLAVMRGRTQALVSNAKALEQCSSRYGKAAVSLFILQKNHGWPAPKRGRPRKSAAR